jgi:hypothetical protein
VRKNFRIETKACFQRETYVNGSTTPVDFALEAGFVMQLAAPMQGFPSGKLLLQLRFHPSLSTSPQ